MSRVYAKGLKSVGICARSGQKMRLSDMVTDGEYPFLLVHPAWKEDRHPQERLQENPDPVALRAVAPDIDRDSASLVVLHAVPPPAIDQKASATRHLPIVVCAETFGQVEVRIGVEIESEGPSWEPPGWDMPGWLPV